MSHTLETNPETKSNKQSPREIKLDFYQALSVELIATSVKVWRTYKETEKTRSIKIQQAKIIHDMITDAMRYHPDIQHVKELADYHDEAERLIAVARKIHRFDSRPNGNSRAPATPHPT